MASELLNGSGSGSDSGRTASQDASVDHQPGSANGRSGRAKEHNPALSRNQACRTCRARKVRCDAVKPACSACRKTANVQNKNPDEVVCEYDLEEVSSRKRKGTTIDEKAGKKGNTKKVADLQKTIGEIKSFAVPSFTHVVQVAEGMLSFSYSCSAELESKLHTGSGTTYRRARLEFKRILWRRANVELVPT